MIRKTIFYAIQLHFLDIFDIGMIFCVNDVMRNTQSCLVS